MEKAKTRKIKKWDEFHGECEVEEAVGVGPSISKNPMRSIEDMVEQNDNNLDGVINNVPTETVAEKEARSSVIEKLKATTPDKHCSKCHCPNDREAR